MEEEEGELKEWEREREKVRSESGGWMDVRPMTAGD